MRSFLSPPNRRTKAREKYQSRFKKGVSNKGNRDLSRFRRNREIMAREITTTVIWIAIGLMMIPLGRTLWRVAASHMSDRALALQLALPAIALIAGVLCLLRARANLREFREVRLEQREILERLQKRLDDQA